MCLIGRKCLLGVNGISWGGDRIYLWLDGLWIVFCSVIIFVGRGGCGWCLLVIMFVNLCI